MDEQDPNTQQTVDPSPVLEVNNDNENKKEEVPQKKRENSKYKLSGVVVHGTSVNSQHLCH